MGIIVNKAIAELNDADGGVLIASAAGGMRLDAWLPTRTFELAVHTLDIAHAVSLPLSLPDVVIAATQQIIAAFASRWPGWHVDMQQAPGRTPLPGSPAATSTPLLRLPVPGEDTMRIEVPLSEPRWAMLPAAHPLSARDQISFHQLWDESFVAAPQKPAGGAITGWPPTKAKAIQSTRSRHRSARHLADRDRQRRQHRPDH